MMSESKEATRRRGVPLPSAVKEFVRSWPPVERAWTFLRTQELHREYRQRREHYARAAAERKIVYREQDVLVAARKRIAGRGYTPTLRLRGEVHTFACIPIVAWHGHLLPDLRELGQLTLFDYEALGYRYADFIRHDARATRLRNEMSDRLFDSLCAAHRERPVDWVFFYGGGQDISPVLVRRITEHLGIPVANLSLDDKQGWAGESSEAWRTGAVDITREFDVYATSARVACEWHLVEEGRPLYMPEGVDAAAFAPRAVGRDIDVSFVGNAYGFRRAVVREVRTHGIDLHTFGSGWPRSGWVRDPIEVFNRSTINLGMGGVEYSESLTNVKGRDFEIPATGGGMYLTTFNPDLALHFVVGSEIVCYRNRDELVELIRWYLQHPDEANDIAGRGRARCLREHRWLHRYEKMLGALGILGGAEPSS